MAQSPCSFTSPCWFPFAPFSIPLYLYLETLLAVIGSRPPWSQVTRKLSSPFSTPPHSLPIPNSQYPGRWSTVEWYGMSFPFFGTGNVKIFTDFLIFTIVNGKIYSLWLWTSASRQTVNFPNSWQVDAWPTFWSFMLQFPTNFVPFFTDEIYCILPV
jgi:hypothetical protein